MKVIQKRPNHESFLLADFVRRKICLDSGEKSRFHTIIAESSENIETLQNKRIDDRVMDL